MEKFRIHIRILLILCFMSPISTENVIPIQNKPIHYHNPRVPQFKMVHMKGDLNNNTFALFKNLNGLEIERCAINNLSPGTFKNTKLEILDIHDNIEFPQISSTTFEHLRNLKVFRFTFNPYTEIEEGAFVKLKHLDVLVISHQNLKTITKTFLEGLYRLRELSLASNEIEYIDSNAFEHMKELTSVFLGHNSIKIIVPGTFRNQRKLENLQLEDNQLGNADNLYNIDLRKFDRILSLKYLNIAKNGLSYINIQDLTTNFPFLESLNFLPNNLTCSTELHVTKTIRHYRIQIEYYGNNYSNCKSFDLLHLGATVFDSL